MQIARAVLGNVWVLMFLAAATAVAFAYVHLGPKSQRIRRLGRSFTFLAFALILAATLYPTGASGAPGLNNCVDSLSTALSEPTSGEAGQRFLNILLFVPCSLMLGLTARRPFLAVFVLVGASAAIEVVQALSGSHTCSGADWRANIIGCLIGGAVGTLARLTWRRYSQWRNSGRVIPSPAALDARNG